MTEEDEFFTLKLAGEEEVLHERLIAFARLAVMLLAQVAMIMSWTIDVDALTTIAVTAIDLAFLVWQVWWTNQNITKDAVAAQQIKSCIDVPNAAMRLVPDGSEEDDA